MRRHRVLILLAVSSLLGCSKQGVGQASTAPVLPPGPVDSFAGAEEHVVVRDGHLHFLPTAELRVKNPFANGKTTNRVAKLERGTRVRVVGEREGWMAVVLPGGTRGWTQTANLRRPGEAVEATVLRPVVATLRAGGDAGQTRMRAGALLHVLDSDGVFSRVADGSATDVWVPTSELSHDPAELGVSRILARLRGVGPAPSPEADPRALVYEAETRHPRATLLTVLRQEASDVIGAAAEDAQGP